MQFEYKTNYEWKAMKDLGGLKKRSLKKLQMEIHEILACSQRKKI